MYCPECGQDHHAGEREERAEADRAVEIARLETKRDIEVARIQAGVIRDTTELEAGTEVEVAEIEAVAGTEAAEAVADALTDVLAPEPSEMPEPPAPVVIDAGTDEGSGSIEPKDETHLPPAPKKSSLSYWPS